MKTAKEVALEIIAEASRALPPGFKNKGWNKSVKGEDPSQERAMRDRMNGIQRDKDGNVTHRNNKPIAKKEDIKEDMLDEGLSIERLKLLKASGKLSEAKFQRRKAELIKKGIA